MATATLEKNASKAAKVSWDELNVRDSAKSLNALYHQYTGSDAKAYAAAMKAVSSEEGGAERRGVLAYSLAKVAYTYMGLDGYDEAAKRVIKFSEQIIAEKGSAHGIDTVREKWDRVCDLMQHRRKAA